MQAVTHVLADLDDTLYRRPEVPAGVKRRIGGPPPPPPPPIPHLPPRRPPSLGRPAPAPQGPPRRLAARVRRG